METLHVLDLPQLYTKPSADILLETLGLLTSAPPSWENSDTEEVDDVTTTLHRRRNSNAKPSGSQVKVSTEGLARYLTGIVASNLRWISDEEVKEKIWGQASLRLSERSGRTGMPAITRTFRIPRPRDTFDLAIHEPALTADNLGLKTWASSYQLAKRLHRLNLPEFSGSSGFNVLELGAGTGLVGLAAAATLGWSVCLTDLPEITPNLQRNAEANHEIISSLGGFTCVGTLDWTDPTNLHVHSELGPGEVEALEEKTRRFQVILVADALYLSDHPRMLVQTINARLADNKDALVVASMPKRTLFKSELDDFTTRMSGIGLKIESEGQETGQDDWGWSPEKEELGEVTCWWSIWRRG